MVFDIGANNGTKTDIYRRFSSEVVCVDPDRKNIAALNFRYAPCDSVHVVPKAVGEDPGVATFHVYAPGGYINTLSRKWRETLESTEDSPLQSIARFDTEYEVEVTTLDVLIREFGTPDFIKIDVEGYEIEALRGLSYPVRYLQFEANLPQFRAETLECIEKLKSLSPHVRFSHTTAPFLAGNLSNWQSSAELSSLIEQTPERFLDVLANLLPGSPKNGHD